MGRLSVIALLGFVFIWGGCTGEPPKPTKVPMPSPAKKEAKVPPAPAKTPATPLVAKPSAVVEEKVAPPPVVLAYNYNPQGKTDPFKPLYQEPKPEPQVQREKPPLPEPRTPLERVELGQLKLVAVVWGIPVPRAMVETAKGEGFILEVGTPIGRNQGMVTKIEPKGVMVTEKEWVGEKYKNVERTLKLYEE